MRRNCQTKSVTTQLKKDKWEALENFCQFLSSSLFVYLFIYLFNLFIYLCIYTYTYIFIYIYICIFNIYRTLYIYIYIYIYIYYPTYQIWFDSSDWSDWVLKMPLRYVYFSITIIFYPLVQGQASSCWPTVCVTVWHHLIMVTLGQGM